MGKTGGTSSVEFERKFDVPAGSDDTALPSFDGLPGVSRTQRQPDRSLEAVYFDTHGHDLSANRIALRRRTGGPDEGWHLKLPSAPGASAEARTEIHAPLGPEVPAELRDVVLAIVRDRPLIPVARIRNTRGVTTLHGEYDIPLAEFCDDRVTAHRLGVDGSAEAEQQWREWELELVDGAAGDAVQLLDRLTERLLAAGAVPSGHGSKLAKVLGDSPRQPACTDPMHLAVAAQVGKLIEWDRAVRADADDAVHQMRVTTRQIRSLLQASEDAFGITDDASILGELRELAAVLGVARDAEVLAERYRAALDALPPELVRGPVRDRLVEGSRRQYRAGLRRSVAAMRSARYLRLLDALDSLVLSQPPPEDSQKHLTITVSHRKVRKAAKAAAAAATPHDHDQALHRIRKAAKRVRYVAAATGDTDVEQRAKTVQSLLGDHQDSVVSREHLLVQAEAAQAAFEDTFTYGVIFQQEAELAQRCRTQLPDALDALSRSVRKARKRPKGRKARKAR